MAAVTSVGISARQTDLTFRRAPPDRSCQKKTLPDPRYTPDRFPASPPPPDRAPRPRSDPPGSGPTRSELASPRTPDRAVSPATRFPSRHAIPPAHPGSRTRPWHGTQNDEPWVKPSTFPFIPHSPPNLNKIPTQPPQKTPVCIKRHPNRGLNQPMMPMIISDHQPVGNWTSRRQAPPPAGRTPERIRRRPGGHPATRRLHHPFRPADRNNLHIQAHPYSIHDWASRVTDAEQVDRREIMLGHHASRPQDPPALPPLDLTTG